MVPVSVAILGILWAAAASVCGCVTEPDEPSGCPCGLDPAEISAPKLLAGKYRLARRLGAGGMGAVYLARDLQLERDVAVKTLADASGSRLVSLKPEAWAMATVTHAAVAQIHGVESWRGRPFLIVENLAGGTLADRLRQGPAPAAEAVSMAAVLGDALGALHRAGYLHGDVKPSNIGFTSDGSPKLLRRRWRLPERNDGSRSRMRAANDVAGRENGAAGRVDPATILPPRTCRAGLRPAGSRQPTGPGSLPR